MVNIQFEGGAIANLTMTAFTRDVCARYTRITGSKVSLDRQIRLCWVRIEEFI